MAALTVRLCKSDRFTAKGAIRIRNKPFYSSLSVVTVVLWVFCQIFWHLDNYCFPKLIYLRHMVEDIPVFGNIDDHNPIACRNRV